MRAIVLRRYGAPDVLEFDQINDPEPGPGEVRVKVAAVAVARSKDVGTRAGRPPFAQQIPGLPHVLGTEHAGVIDAVGPGVDPGMVGGRVAVSAVLTCSRCRACERGRAEACTSLRLIGIHRQGSYAEYCLAPVANVHALPDDVGFAQAATLAANGGVAHAQLDAGMVGPGSNVLVLGASGALGSTVAALAAFRGANVIGVDRLSAKPDCLEGLPLAASLDGEAPGLAETILDVTDGWGVDAVIDNLGLPLLRASYQDALAVLGTIVFSGAISYDPITIRPLPFYVRSQSLIGVRTGNPHHISALWQGVAAGFRVPDRFVRALPWTSVGAAHQASERGGSRGQAVLEVT